MNEQEKISLLANAQTIAIVGLSPKEDRPSHKVAEHLQAFSYKIVPVRPGVTEILSESAYKSLSEVPHEVDIVNVFRASQFVPQIVDECIQFKMPAIWLQEGIEHQQAIERAREAGILATSNLCIYKEIIRLNIKR